MMTADRRLPALRAALETEHFAHVPDFSELIPGAGALEDTFNAYWDDLVLDENFKSYTTRHRRILRYWYRHPGELTLNPDNIYQPKVTYDADYTHGANRLAYATDAFVEDVLMRQILLLDLEILAPQLVEGQDYSVDVDLFRVSADSGGASPTTSGRHQDGEDFLCMHFVGARNIRPVVSEILSGDPKAAPLLQKPMTRFLETLVVNDRELFHAAGPVAQDDTSAPAHRNLLLVSVSALSTERAH